MYSALRFFCRAVGYSKTHSAISDCANRCVNFKHRFSGYRRQLVLCYAETLSLESPFPKNSEIKCQCSCSSTFGSDWANRSLYFTLRFFCRCSKAHSADSDCANRCVNFTHRFSGHWGQLCGANCENSNKSESENVTAARVSFSREYLALKTRNFVNDVDQRS